MAKRGRKSSIASMSVDALFKLRDDVAKALSSKAADLQKQLSLLGGGNSLGKGKRRGRSAKGRKVAAKYRSKKDPKQIWSGRGQTPRWMVAEMKGTKLKKESFAIR
jgi:DNA-binding protein H-NS